MIAIGGQPSKDYVAIVNQTELADLAFHGSALPTVFGSLVNTVTYKAFSLSANFSFKAGYYFRRSSISYAVFCSKKIRHVDYYSRWQNPGDEVYTEVPSFDLRDRKSKRLNSSH